MRKVGNPDQGNRRLMKIGQLSQESGITKSLIHHYLNLGLIPKPVQVGLAVHLYDETHLARLREIRRLRKDANLPLAQIKEILDGQDWSLENIKSKAVLTNESTGTEPIYGKPDDPATVGKRQRILQTATDFFSRRAYSAVRISDITDALHMGKSTFYLYFKNKQELFMECIEHLSFAIVPRERWDEIKKETDFFKRTTKRASAVIDAFSGYSGIINQARMVCAGEDPDLAEKAKESLKLLIRPPQRDIERGQKNGTVRQIDSELAAYFTLALVECLAERLHADSRYTVEEGLRIFDDFIKRGLGPKSGSHAQEGAPDRLFWEVTDIMGVKTRITEPRIDGKAELTAKIGEAQVQVELDKICSLRSLDHETVCTFEVTSTSDERSVLEIEDDAMLTGRSHLGSFGIPWKGVSEVAVTE